MKIILLLLLTLNLIAADDYSLRLAYGTASENDLGEIISGDFGSHSEDLNVLALDGGYLLKESAFEWPMDVYAKAGLSYFDEGSYSDVYEMTLYIKAYWNFDFLGNRIRAGIGEGISYTSDILRTEYLEAQAKEDNNSNFLNYIDVSVDVDFGKLIRYKPLHNTYLGYALKHRSGIYGLINGVTNGGSNYNTLYIEKNF